MKNKKYDYFFSILSALFNVLILQIVCFPIINKHVDVNKFGEILLIFAIVNSFSLVFGNTLNNIRLVNINKYNKDDFNSFNGFLTIITLINAMLMFITLKYLHINLFEIILIIIWSTLLLIKSYYIVEFRIIINFVKILITTLIYSFSLLFTLLLIIFFNQSFYFSFIFSEAFSLLYVLIHTNLIKETFSKNITFKIKRDYLVLFSSNILNNLINYIDRFVISFILGKRFIAVFFAATVLGKLSTLLIQPISSVILSYGVKEEDEGSVNKFSKTMLINFFLSILITIFIYILSIPIINILYPNLLSEAYPIIFFANFGVVILAVGTIAQSSVMARGKLIEQFKINLVFLIVFFAIIYSLTINYKLLGFSIALIISSLCKYISIWYFGKKYFKDR